MASEEDFIDVKTNYIYLAIGGKGGGKSFLLLNFVRHHLQHNSFDEYHLVLPSFKNEQNDSYAWLADYKKQVYIYSEYSPYLTNKLIERGDTDDPKKKRRVFYAIDDSTSMSKDIKNDPGIMTIATQSRHLGITFYLVSHGSRSILQAAFRQQIDRLVIYRITNRKLLEAIYEEWFSTNPMFPDFKTWLAFYNEYVLNVEYGAIFVNLRTMGHENFTPFVKEWAFNQPQKKRAAIKQHDSGNQSRTSGMGGGGAQTDRGTKGLGQEGQGTDLRTKAANPRHYRRPGRQ
jgi:hypothetical protein